MLTKITGTLSANGQVTLDIKPKFVVAACSSFNSSISYDMKASDFKLANDNIEVNGNTIKNKGIQLVYVAYY